MNVIVAEPPHAAGAPLLGLSELLLLLNTGLQPPLTLAVANHALYATSIALCDWHEPTVKFCAGVNT